MTTTATAQVDLREEMSQWHLDIDDALEDIESFATSADLDAITMAICAHASHVTEILVECVRQHERMPSALDNLRKQCEIVQNQLQFQLKIIETRSRLEIME